MKLVPIFAVILAFIAFWIFNRIKKNQFIRMNLKSLWGTVPNTQYKSNDFSSIRSYFENRKKEGELPFYIDDITWNDLDMDKVFARVNHTQTSMGEEYLYATLREPLFDPDALAEQNDLVTFFQKHPAEREEIQFLLSKIGKRRHCNISNYIFGGHAGTLRNGRIYKILTLIFVLSPLVAIFYQYAILIFFITMIINAVLYMKVKGEIVGHLESLGYIVNMVNTAKKMGKTNVKGLEKYLQSLKDASVHIKGVSINSFYLIFYTSENYLFEMIKVLFLGEPIAFDNIFKLIRKYKKELNEIYRTLGILDSCLSIASYRDSIDYYTTPELKKCQDPSQRTLKITAIYHPLVQDPVSNSLNIEKPVLLTGSNASGKSTFLKTLAVNAIFAQTIFTCLASEYESSYFKIFSSMALKDNLLSQESYYIVEIKSLKRILENLEKEIPCLCVIDEVLRGTNTIERIAASSEILHFLSKSHCLCISATHDIELASILGKDFSNYHFQEQFQNNEITFDYKLYPGKSYTRNAIKLLSVIGYKEEIVHRANKRAQHFLESGHWGKV